MRAWSIAVRGTRSPPCSSSRPQAIIYRFRRADAAVRLQGILKEHFAAHEQRQQPHMAQCAPVLMPSCRVRHHPEASGFRADTAEHTGLPGHVAVFRWRSPSKARKKSRIRRSSARPADHTER